MTCSNIRLRLPCHVSTVSTNSYCHCRIKAVVAPQLVPATYVAEAFCEMLNEALDQLRCFLLSSDTIQDGTETSYMPWFAAGTSPVRRVACYHEYTEDA